MAGTGPLTERHIEGVSQEIVDFYKPRFEKCFNDIRIDRAKIESEPRKLTEQDLVEFVSHVVNTFLNTLSSGLQAKEIREKYETMDPNLVQSIKIGGKTKELTVSQIASKLGQVEISNEHVLPLIKFVIDKIRAEFVAEPEVDNVIREVLKKLESDGRIRNLGFKNVSELTRKLGL